MADIDYRLIPSHRGRWIMPVASMLIAEQDLLLAPIEELQDINDVAFPSEHRFRQFLVTGPPGAGKSTLVSKMHGWPYEGYLDLAAPDWWRERELTFRPREVHLGAPFQNRPESLAVLDSDWIENYDTLEIDYRRIEIPPRKTWFLGVNWRTKYAFDFVLPPAETVYADRIERARTGLFPHDRLITPDIVDAQVAFYRSLAWFFWISEMHVYIRLDREGPPMKIVACNNAPAL